VASSGSSRSACSSFFKSLLTTSYSFARNVTASPRGWRPSPVVGAHTVRLRHPAVACSEPPGERQRRPGEPPRSHASDWVSGVSTSGFSMTRVDVVRLILLAPQGRARFFALPRQTALPPPAKDARWGPPAGAKGPSTTTERTSYTVRPAGRQPGPCGCGTQRTAGRKSVGFLRCSRPLATGTALAPEWPGIVPACSTDGFPPQCVRLQQLLSNGFGGRTARSSKSHATSSAGILEVDAT
jgi:hypothetical protein